MGRFVKVSAMDLAKTMIEVDFANTANQFSDKELDDWFYHKTVAC